MWSSPRPELFRGYAANPKFSLPGQSRVCGLNFLFSLYRYFFSYTFPILYPITYRSLSNVIFLSGVRGRDFDRYLIFSHNLFLLLPAFLRTYSFNASPFLVWLDLLFYKQLLTSLLSFYFPLPRFRRHISGNGADQRRALERYETNGVDLLSFPRPEPDGSSEQRLSYKKG